MIQLKFLFKKSSSINGTSCHLFGTHIHKQIANFDFDYPLSSGILHSYDSTTAIKLYDLYWLKTCINTCCQFIFG